MVIRYADNGQSYWTGYFTSRQGLKSESRSAHGFLRAVETTHAFVRDIFPVDSEAQLKDLYLLKSTEAVVQHHDGVTGTYRDLVGKDYFKLLAGGVAAANNVFDDNVGRLVSGGLTNQLTSNVSAIEDLINVGRAASVVVTNPLSWERVEYVHVAGLSTDEFEVVQHNGQGAVAFQVNLSPDGTTFDLFVKVTVPALGVTSFVVEPLTGKHKGPVIKAVRPQRVSNRLPAIENEYVYIEINNATNCIGLVINKVSGAAVTGDQTAHVYASYNSGQTSGAYIFRPRGSATPAAVASVETVTGPYVNEIRTTYAGQSWVQITRLFSGLDALEGSAIHVEHIIGPLVTDHEVVMRFNTDLATGSTFYTDSNGLELMQRTNSPTGRPGDSDEGVRIAGNYYPAVTRAFIRDANTGTQLTYVSQSSHGAASLANGQLEVMLHRRCSRDDARGMNEPLNDADKISGYFRFFVDGPEESGKGSNDNFFKLMLLFFF